MAQSKMKLPPGAELVDDTQSMPLPPGAELVPESPAQDFSANPKREGTYKMVTPSDGGAIKLIDVPYSRVQDAFSSGYTLGKSGDSKRYAEDKFTELNKNGKKPNPNIDYAGVSPTPARGTKEWWKNTGVSATHKALGLLPTAGSLAFGTLAGGLGLETGPADIAIASGVSGIGAAGGEEMRQELEEKLFPDQVKLTPSEKARGILVQGGLGAASEGVGRGLSNFVFRPPIQSLRGTAEASEKAGFRMLPSEASGKAPSIFESYPKASIFTRGRMANWRELQNQETEKAANDLADSISKMSLSKTGSREEAGQVIRKSIEDHMAKFRKNQQAMYNRVDKVAKINDIKPSRIDVRAFAKKELDRLNSVERSYGKSRMTPFKETLQDIVNNDSPYAPWRDAKDFRSKLLSDARNDNSLMSGPEKSFLSKMAGMVDESMADALKKSKTPQLYDLWRQANKITRDEHITFEQRLIENLAAKKNPEDIALVLRGNSPGAISPVGIQETRDAMSVIPKQMIPRVQKQILLDTMYESTKKGTQPFNEKAFAKGILQIGDERGNVLFGGNWPKIKEFSELLNRITESAGLQAASLSNPEMVKQTSRFILESVIGGAGGRAGGHTLAGAAIPLMSEAALWNAAATALTHPQGSAKILNAMRLMAKGIPYATTATMNETVGYQKGIDRIKEEAKKLQQKSFPQPAAPVPQVQFAPDGSVIHSEGTGPQSSAKPVWTHVFNPDTGEIEAA